jgi:hypothetical protein
MRRDQLLAITKIIARGFRPEKIILFGTFADGAGMEDPSSIHSRFPVSYELLVVTARGDRRYDYEVQDLLENRCYCPTPVTVLVHGIDHVNEQLSAGHYFFSMLDREGIMLYDAGHIPLTAGILPDLAHIRAIAEKDFEQWSLRARAFFRSVLFNKEEKEWRIAVILYGLQTLHS